MLLPVRNGAMTLAGAAESVLKGTFEDLSLVVVDDGSTDETRKVARALLRDDPRVMIVSTPPRGLSAALNQGLRACFAPFVARMDSDDQCDPTRLERQLRFLEENSEIGVVGCRVRAEPSPLPGTGLMRYLSWQNRLLDHDSMYAERFVESPLCHATAVFRRFVLMEAGGWFDGTWAEDVDLWLRLFASSVRFAKLPETLYTWRIHPQSASWTDPRYDPRNLRRAKIHYLLEGHLNRTTRLELWGLGRSLEAWSRDLVGAGAPPFEAVAVNPRLFSRLPPPPADRIVLACYTSAKARERLRRACTKAGWIEGKNIILAA